MPKLYFISSLCFFLLLSLGCAQSPKEMQILKSNSRYLTLWDGEKVRHNGWVLYPKKNVLEHVSFVKEGRAKRVIFESDQGTNVFFIKPGDVKVFEVEYKGKRYAHKLIGKKKVEEAIYSSEFKLKNRGKVRFFIPELYEMVNIVIAISDEALKKDSYLVYKKTPYYEDVIKHFKPFKKHPFAKIINEKLNENNANYSILKMNGNTFVFDSSGKVVPSPIYRGHWGEPNPLNPHLSLIQDFAEKSSFRTFYKKHKLFYSKQLKYFENQIKIKEA